MSVIEGMGRESYDGTIRLSCAETAKLVRKALKTAFPGVKFSVRSSTYSGGASIRVGWTDGPTSKEVEAITGKFSGAGFDGMIDLKYHKEHWLMPDGSVEVARNEGTAGSRGSVEGYFTDPPSPNARLVSFAADYVFAERDTSAEWTEEVVSEFERVLDRDLPRDQNEWWRLEVPLSVDRWSGELYRMVEHEKESLSTVVRQYQSARNRSTGEVVSR
jgi:Large polyvalent protein associated domain 29